MPFNLGTFRQKVHSIGRSQYFLVRIPQVGDAETLTALARSTTIPQMTHDVGDVWYRGLAMKLDMRPTFDAWTVRFLCDEPHSLRNIFNKWMESAYSVQTLRNMGHNDYKRDGLSVSQLSSDKQVMSTYTFYGAWPTTVGSIELSQENAAVVEFDINFTYDYFVQNSLAGDVVFSDVDIAVSNAGIMEGVSVRGIAGVTLNL